MGVNGAIPKFAQPGACIIASTYGEGLNKFDQHFVSVQPSGLEHDFKDLIKGCLSLVSIDNIS